MEIDLSFNKNSTIAATEFLEVGFFKDNFDR